MMMGRSKQKPLLERLMVTDLAAEGKAIARHEGMVVFVTKCIPGDVVDVQIIRKRKRYLEGFPIRFHAYSPDREEPFCRHFGICGGCQWQQLPYLQQLKFKQQQVADALGRIGKTGVEMMMPILPSEKQKFYRNKLEFTFSHSRWLTDAEVRSGLPLQERRALGFHMPGKFDKVLDIETCFLQPEPSNDIRNFVKQYAINRNLEFFDLSHQQGFLRNLIIRNNLAGEVMLVFSFFRDDPEAIPQLLDAVAQQFPQVVSILYVINPKANDTLNDLEITRYRGQDHLTETMEDLRFRISPKSFFQTNTAQAYRLYCLVRDMAGLTGQETVYDLYTGTGTIALFLARKCSRVVGLEFVQEAVDDARRNAALNGITNALFLAGDIRGLLSPRFIAEHGRPDVVVTDPPRTGMHADVIQSILEASPKRIVYVSCNPATQARDIALLADRYAVLKAQPVDMFPFTQHVENIVLLAATTGGS
jgi:23S rRNA (uracil1939-C5)-methyltransferase